MLIEKRIFKYKIPYEIFLNTIYSDFFFVYLIDSESADYFGFFFKTMLVLNGLVHDFQPAINKKERTNFFPIVQKSQEKFYIKLYK